MIIIIRIRIIKIMEGHQNNWEHHSLSQARARLISFMSELQQHRKTDIRPDILIHCEQVNRNRRVISSYISDQTVLRMVGSRIQKMVKNKKIKKNWSQEDIKILVWVLSKYCDLYRVIDPEKDITLDDWQRMAQLIPGVSGNSCMFKWLSIRKVNLSACNWSPQQSSMLREIISQHNARDLANDYSSLSWKDVAQELYFRNQNGEKVFRSAKQCREHWNCFLNPMLRKGPWKQEEDIRLLSIIKSNNGEKKWSQIVHSFEGRTENALKNRYTLLIDKQRKVSKSKQEISLIEDCLERYQGGEKEYEEEEGESEVGNGEGREEDRLKELSQAKSQQNTTTISSPNNAMKIHYLTTSEQFQFFQWIKRRNDIKRCCLKNGSIQIQQ